MSIQNSLTSVITNLAGAATVLKAKANKEKKEAAQAAWKERSLAIQEQKNANDARKLDIAEKNSAALQEKTAAETNLINSKTDLTLAKTKQVKAETKNINAKTKLVNAQTEKTLAQANKLNAQAANMATPGLPESKPEAVVPAAQAEQNNTEGVTNIEMTPEIEKLQAVKERFAKINGTFEAPAEPEVKEETSDEPKIKASEYEDPVGTLEDYATKNGMDWKRYAELDHKLNWPGPDQLSEDDPERPKLKREWSKLEKMRAPMILGHRQATAEAIEDAWKKLDFNDEKFHKGMSWDEANDAIKEKYGKSVNELYDEVDVDHKQLDKMKKDLDIYNNYKASEDGKYHYQNVDWENLYKEHPEYESLEKSIGEKTKTANSVYQERTKLTKGYTDYENPIIKGAWQKELEAIDLANEEKAEAERSEKMYKVWTDKARSEVYKFASKKGTLPKKVQEAADRFDNKDFSNKDGDMETLNKFYRKKTSELTETKGE